MISRLNTGKLSVERTLSGIWLVLDDKITYIHEICKLVPKDVVALHHAVVYTRDSVLVTLVSVTDRIHMHLLKYKNSCWTYLNYFVTNDVDTDIDVKSSEVYTGARIGTGFYWYSNGKIMGISSCFNILDFIVAPKGFMVSTTAGTIVIEHITEMNKATSWKIVYTVVVEADADIQEHYT